MNITSEFLRKERSRMKLNQSIFWQALGVTQSGGSRYESGRNIPGYIKLLYPFIYGSEAEFKRAIEKTRRGKCKRKNTTSAT